MPEEISQIVLMPGPPPLPVNRRKDRHGKNITLATCVIRMREVIIATHPSCINVFCVFRDGMSPEDRAHTRSMSLYSKNYMFYQFTEF